ncbi:MAG TPA: DUF6056 family protein [Bacteroidia bacterium]|nr:DUF6056 family protein [Bacteroidia bacterium]
MNNKYFKRFSYVLLLFLILLSILCFCFRISTDDYFYIAEVERIGVIKIITSAYLKWSGRFAASAVMNTFFKILHDTPHYFFLIPLATFIFLIIGIYRVINALFNYYHIEYSLFKKWVLSASFMMLLFFLSVNIGETWFWCSSIGCYLYSVVAFVWGLGFILQGKTNLLTYAGIACCFVFIGGSTEVFSSVFLLIIFSVLLYYYRTFCSAAAVTMADKNNRSVFIQFKQHPTLQKLLFAFIFLSLGLIILIVAPGNYVRDQLFPSHRFFFSFLVTAKSFVKFFIFYVPHHLHVLLAFATLFLVAGGEIRKQTNMQLNLPFPVFFKRTTGMFVLTLGVFFYLVAYIMSETGPARIWFMASFLFAAYSCVISFYAGYCNLFSAKQLRTIRFLGLLTAGIILSFSVINQAVVATRYAVKYDEREQQLLKWKEEIKKDTLLHVQPLPDPGMLYSAEISADSSHFTNQHLRMVYKLNYHVVKN